MPDQDFEYDVFLSHAGEDTSWCETLAERLRNEGVRVWFDKWHLQPGDNVLAKINDGLAKSRKMIAVWSANYFRDGKVWTLVESFSQLHGDPLSQDRPIIPLLIEDCTILPTFRNILYIDFRNKHDFDLRFRQLLQALDLPKQEFEQEDKAFMPASSPSAIYSTPPPSSPSPAPVAPSRSPGPLPTATHFPLGKVLVGVVVLLVVVFTSYLLVNALKSAKEKTVRDNEQPATSNRASPQPVTPTTPAIVYSDSGVATASTPLRVYLNFQSTVHQTRWIGGDIQLVGESGSPTLFLKNGMRYEGSYPPPSYPTNQPWLSYVQPGWFLVSPVDTAAVITFFSGGK